MNLSLIITRNCAACKRVQNVLKDIVLRYPELKLNVINVNDFTGKGVIIVPALLIDDELYSYGDVDEAKLLSYISRKQNTAHKSR